jgi:hypothetical protein
MLLLLIVIPCTIVGAAVVLLLDRVGVLPRLGEDGGSRPVPLSSSAPFLARPASLAVIVLMAAWILAWLVLLGVGLDIVFSAT